MPEAHTNISDNAVRNPAERGLSLKKCTWSRSDTIRSAGEGEGFVPLLFARFNYGARKRRKEASESARFSAKFIFRIFIYDNNRDIYVIRFS